MKCSGFIPAFAGLALGLFTLPVVSPLRAETPIPVTRASAAAVEEPSEVPSRIVDRIDEGKLVALTGNRYPDALPKYDRGLLDPDKLLEKIILVLKRSPEQEKALHDFNERQYQEGSPDFHRWLHPEEFGKLYGPSDADIAAVTNWLQNHGFSIDLVSKGRVTIQFTGTVAQVQDTFHVEMHRYFIGGKEHVSNDRDPQIPEALLPVITGIASLNDFFPVHSVRSGNLVRRDRKTGKFTLWNPVGTASPEPAQEPGYYVSKESHGGIKPDYGWVDPSNSDQREDLTPYDVAAIYNILPLWNSTTPLTGAGVTVAIVGVSDVETSDFNTFRSSFGLPASTFTTLHSGGDPGFTSLQGENTEDTEMVSATAPGAKIVLVSDVSNTTTNGLNTAATYIIENEIAPILTMSFLQCEAGLGTAGNAFWNNTFQQATTEGITPFVCAGDSGSSLCTLQNGTPPYGDQYGLAVNGMASNPYVTAVGGTDLQWPFSGNPYTDYWNSTTDPTTGASAKGYMPEMTWNATCTNPILLSYFGFTSSETLCNTALESSEYDAIVDIASGSGGKSACTTNTGTIASCSGGYPKPSWQAGVPGIPADGVRDLPDTSFFASYAFGQGNNVHIPGSALLVCISSFSPDTSCDYTDPTQIIYQENGGTSAATPLTAGIMAMILQKTGSKQGLANPVLYKLAASENYSACNSNTVAAGNSCIFYDTTVGSNAMNCYPGGLDCVTNVSGDQVGIISGYSATAGYDYTTGLGTLNVANLVKAWPTTSGTPAITLSPTAVTFPGTTLVGATDATTETITIKNTGTAPAGFTNFAFSGAGQNSFNLSSGCPGPGSTLAAGASCTAVITFVPQAVGTQTATLTVSDNAGTGSQTATITGVGTSASAPAVTLSPTSIAFASTPEGGETAAQIVTVKNSGTAALTIGSIAVAGTNPTDFLKTATTCTTTLAAGASCTVSVAFKPLATGALAATLAVTDNAAGSPQSVTLTGTGTATAPVVTLTPASIAFAATPEGTETAAQVVTVKNSGTAALTIGSIAVAGTNPTDFLKTATTCTSSLAVGASCTVSVAFKPLTVGALAATLAITDNAAGSPQAVKLTGTGTAVTTPVVTLSPTSLTFAATNIGTETASQPVTLKNTGAGTLNLTSVTFTGTDPTSFVDVTDTCGTTLAAGASCVILVAMKPAVAGALTANLSFADNAAGTPQVVKLSGTGNAPLTPIITLSATTLAYPNTIVGTTSDAQILVVKNTGGAAATLSKIALAETNPTDFELLNGCGTTLPASGFCYVYVAFKPATAAAFAATVSITDNAAGSPQAVKLTGTGTADPTIKLSATTLAFPTTTHGTVSAPVAVTVTNSGTSAVELTSIAISGTNATSFTEINTCSATLAAAASCTVYVAFAPTTTGALTAKLSVADTGVFSPQSVVLTGTGK